MPSLSFSLPGPAAASAPGAAASPALPVFLSFAPSSVASAAAPAGLPATATSGGAAASARLSPRAVWLSSGDFGAGPAAPGPAARPRPETCPPAAETCEVITGVSTGAAPGAVAPGRCGAWVIAGDSAAAPIRARRRIRPRSDCPAAPTSARPPAKTVAAARSAPDSAASPGPETSDFVCTAPPPPDRRCCTTWASSWAISPSPAADPGAKRPGAKAMSDPVVKASACRPAVAPAASAPVWTRTSAKEVPKPASIRARRSAGRADPPTNPRWIEVRETGAASAVGADDTAGWAAREADSPVVRVAWAGLEAVGPAFMADLSGLGRAPDAMKGWSQDQPSFRDLNTAAFADQDISIRWRCPASRSRSSSHGGGGSPTILSVSDQGAPGGRTGSPMPE